METPAPIWLKEEGWAVALLHWLLDRLDKPHSRAITRRITPTTLPALFRFGNNAELHWAQLQQLANDYEIFEIRLDPRLKPHQAPWENAQLRLNSACESRLRSWLERPHEDPVQLALQDALTPLRDNFIDRGEALISANLASSQRQAAQLVAGFARINQYLGHDLTLREIAARCFAGDSKFLDQRFELLERLFGKRAHLIPSRPLLLTAYAPTGFTQLLIIENQDSFLRLAGAPQNSATALIYSGGFRASADRLTSSATRFAFLAGSDTEAFECTWRDSDLPAFFWGDLDFSGMAILKALRSSLPQLKAWQPGYAPMLRQLKEGGGHNAAQAHKSGQTDPGMTGCDYADQQLLPAMRLQQRFLDQEGNFPDTMSSPAQ